MTAPDGLESCLTINDGEIHCAGITLGQGMRDFGTVTGRPKFILNGGTVNIKELYCGEYLTEATPYIEINGGELRVQNKGIELSTTGECKTEMVINGGLVEIDAGGVLNLVTAGSMGGAHLKLAGGRLIAAGFVVGSSNATATILFDGGVFQPTASTILSTTIATTVTTGGANFDVPQGVDYTVASPLLHDPELGAAIDGGVVKSGLGSLSLTGINSYTGDTVVQAGGVSISGCSEFVSVLEVAPGAKLALVAPVQGTFTLSELTLGDANGPEAELSITATRLQLQTGAVIIGGTLTLGKAYVSVVEAESGQTVAVNGSYVIVAGASAISGAAEDLIFKNPAYGKRYEFVVDGNQLLLNVATVTDGATIWNHNFGGSWDDLDKWVVAPDVGAPGMKIGFLDAITTPAAITLTHEAVAGELLFDNSTPYTLAGAGSLSLESTNGVANLNVAQGAHTVDVAVELTDEVRAEVASGAKLSISGAIAGEGAVVKGGSGTLSLVGANSYSGGTTVNGGSVEVAGVQPLGGGAVNFNEGAIATVVGAAATVPNDVTVAKSMDIVTQAPLTLGGIWNASAPTLFSKKGTNELIIAGNMRFDAGATSRLAIDDGQVVFASGSTAQFYSTGVRNSIDFTTPTATSVVRRLRFESGAKVTADCLYVGYGATNSVEMNGGNLNLLGFGSNNDAFLLGGKREAYSEFTVTGGSLFAADNSWTLLGFESENTVVRMLGGVVSLGRVSLGVRDDAGNNVGNRAQNLWLNMQGGLLEARQGWNWMAEQNGVRLNVVNLMGGTLRLPPTYAATTNRINQSRVIFNGGTLQARGGSTLYPQEFLAGVKQAYVGSDHAIIDTSAYNLAIEQRLMPLDGSSGGVVKRGTGVLALRRPGVEGLLEVEAGTLRLTPEAGGLIPDAPMLRLSFEDGILNEESACKQSLNLLGSINNVVLVDGARGERAARFNGSHVIQVGYRSDMAGVDSYTISAWVRQSAYGGVNTARTFFGNLINYSQTAHEFLLRVLGGDYRMIITGNDNYAYGNLYMDVVGAVPLNHWVMLSLVVDGTNGLSMYVNGEKRTMRINFNGVVTYSDTYGAGKRWLLQPPARTSGKAFMIGSVAANDTAGFIGDIDDVTMYSRALNEAEMELLYTSQVAAPRVCVKEGAKLDLAATTQQVRELSGTGLVGGGEVVVTERLNPGDSPESAPGAWLGIDGSLVLGTNVTYVCDWQAEENDIVEVAKTLTVDGRGFISLGLTDKSQMPGSPRVKSFPVMYYGEIVGAENFAQWEVVDVGRKVDAQIVAADGVVSIRLEVRSGMVLMLR